MKNQGKQGGCGSPAGAAVARAKPAAPALEQAYRLLDAVFNNTHVLIAYLDPQFDFIMVNAAYAAADGRTPGFFPGKNHFGLYPSAENEAIFRRVVASGEPYRVSAKPFEYALNPERGVSHWDWSLVPIRGDDGRAAGLVLTL